MQSLKHYLLANGIAPPVWIAIANTPAWQWLIIGRYYTRTSADRRNKWVFPSHTSATGCLTEPNNPHTRACKLAGLQGLAAWPSPFVCKPDRVAGKPCWNGGADSRPQAKRNGRKALQNSSAATATGSPRED